MDQMVKDRVQPDSIEIDGHENIVSSARMSRARGRAQALRGFYIHVGVFLIVNLGVFVANLLLVLLDATQTWFFYWVLIGWGIAVVINGFVVYTDRFLGPEWEERKVREYLNRDRAK
jgi:hypothetical protein